MQTNEMIYEDLFHTTSEAVNTSEESRVLNHSNTFALLDRMGNIYPRGKMVQGIYHYGTRFIHKLVLSVNGQKPLLLGSAIKEDNDIYSIDLTNPYLENCRVAENSIHISRNQFIREGIFYEEIICSNYCDTPCDLDLSIAFNGDFKDIFEIRGVERNVLINKVEASADPAGFALLYKGQDDLARKAVIHFTSEAQFSQQNLKAVFSIHLAQGKPVTICYSISMTIGEEESATLDYRAAKESIQKDRESNKSLFALVDTSNEHFSHWIRRSQADLLSLLATTSKGLRYPYAGVPWYNTSFGRDGLITAMETLWLAPEISRHVLLFLADKQAIELIPAKDAEPGKILHEARAGEMANTGEIPFKEYYGTTDATPLFVMLAGMYYERTADESLLRQIWPNIKSALSWIDLYGDVDGDGFVEYRHKAKNGLTNQGWKDSFDSVMYEEGGLAEPPIALCEVQAYVYGAKKQAAKLATLMGEEELSGRLQTEAETLKRNFNEKFWDASLGCFVLALDGAKRPCRVISSNAGHCLFTGIVDEDKAKKLADTLLSPEMFSGWGIRTLASREHRFNPMSYHNGSVWPHDNALIAYGLSLYGFQKHVLKLMKVLFEASVYISLERLPELYCGFERRSSEGPTAYPVACSPQAWSVAVVFMLMQACFRIDINAPTKTIVFNKPRLPDFLKYVLIDNLILDGETCSLQMKWRRNDVSFNIMQKPKEWEVLIKK